MKVKLFIAIATLIGTIIGAGILGIPYIVAKAGFITGLVDIVLIGLAILFINLYLGEITLRTKGNHQLAGYANIYLGKWGKELMAFSMVFGIYGALIAYTIGEGEALKTIFGGSIVINSLIFFVIVAALVYLGLRSVGKCELIVTSAIILFILIFSFTALTKIHPENLTGFDATNLFIPYGVILFAFIGMAAIPEMKEELAKNRKELKKAIIIGSLIPLIIYILFALVVVGIVGLSGFESLMQDERIATVALSIWVGKTFAILVNAFAVLAMGTSFLVLGLALKEMYHYDYGLNKNIAWVAVCSLPLSIFLIDAFILDITNFISVLEVVGTLSGGIGGALIVMMFWKAKKIGKRKPEYELKNNSALSYILIGVFVLGIIYQIISFF